MAIDCLARKSNVLKVEAVRTTPKSGDEWARAGEQAHASAQTCYRCKGDLVRTHGPNFFCPEFSKCRGGRWLQWDLVQPVLTRLIRPQTLHWWTTCRFEEIEGAAGSWHRVVGTTVEADTRKVSRFEMPSVPEFSVIYFDPNMLRIPNASECTNPDYEFVYMGWRGQLRSFCQKHSVSYERVARRLGISCDRTDEEVSRYQLGWL